MVDQPRHTISSPQLALAKQPKRTGLHGPLMGAQLYFLSHRNAARRQRPPPSPCPRPAVMVRAELLLLRELERLLHTIHVVVPFLGDVMRGQESALTPTSLTDF